MTQLDALRCFAVLGVMVAHTWRPAPLPSFLAEVDYGELGVRLFFVLSGFLITGILLRAARDDEPAPRRRHAMRQFYVRRFLRIFPVYYLVLVVCLVLAVDPARELWPWLFSYTINIYIWHHQEFVPNLGHFWTLAVEEQFYLLWPLVVLFAPRRRLLAILLGVIAGALAYRLFASFQYTHDITYRDSASLTLIFGVVVGLAVGALLALCSDLEADRGAQRLRAVLDRFALPAGLALYLGSLALQHRLPASHIGVTLAPLGEALVFCWLIGRASRGFGGITGRVLELRPLVYVGVISYGIYVFHLLVPLLVEDLAGILGISYRDTGFVHFAAASALTVAIAALSWRFFEAPINGLKRHFPMPRRSAPRVAAAPLAPGREEAPA